MLGLAESACSGYDVRKQFDSSLRNFWRAELSQIYPALQKLEANGLLGSDEAESTQGPKRKVYRRTASGGEELRRWLQAGPVVDSEKIAWLAQVYFLYELDFDARITFMQKLRQYLDERLERLRAIEAGWSAADPRYPDDLPDDDFFPQLTLDCGLRRVAATLDWCDASIARLQARNAQRPD